MVLPCDATSGGNFKFSSLYAAFTIGNPELRYVALALLFLRPTFVEVRLVKLLADASVS